MTGLGAAGKPSLRLGLRPSHLPPASRGGGSPAVNVAPAPIDAGRDGGSPAANLAPILHLAKRGGGGSGEARDGGGEPFDGVLDGGSFGGAAAGGSETSTKPHPQVAP